MTGRSESVVLLVVSAFLPGAIPGTADDVGYVVSVFVALGSLAVLASSLSADVDRSTGRRPGA